MAHCEDAALHRLPLAGLGVRSTAERVSLSASPWWVGVPLLTDLLVASVASDIYVLLNGTEQAAARDTLRQALECPPELQAQDGLITNALSFLAGYGLYLSVSTDRFISRLLDNLHPPRPHALVGPFSQTKFEAAARFCRVGVLANSLRLAYRVLLPRFPQAWCVCLPVHAPVSAVACSAASAALAQSELDWGTECRLFQVVPPPVPFFARIGRLTHGTRPGTCSLMSVPSG